MSTEIDKTLFHEAVAAYNASTEAIEAAQKLTDDESRQTLIKTAKQSAQKSRNRLDSHIIQLAEVCAKRFAKRCGTPVHIFDDLLTEAMGASVVAMDGAIKNQCLKKSPANYVCRSIFRSLSRFYDKWKEQAHRQIADADDEAIDRFEYAGQFIDADDEDPKAGRFKNDDSPLEGYPDEPVSVENIADSYSANDTIELMEEILASCKDERDCQIVELRADGHSETEVAEELGISVATVSRALNRIGKQYVARGNTLPPETRKPKAKKRPRPTRNASKPSSNDIFKVSV